ncbi:MAG: DUF5683 domain-containing protein [Candidatus Pseudobacter hemicellulosilyticus]|uniref:DUF5683 domain-containing protein n=1 Tax=Candidatus Pseudobacter hemicellulosilyticus TaxID=3121375 RepID=A0AAJ6BID1_9BACT|nr:MAG: DUF5683 domain-containing protein [Pseudobacter sp.]
MSRFLVFACLVLIPALLKAQVPDSVVVKRDSIMRENSREAVEAAAKKEDSINKKLTSLDTLALQDSINKAKHSPRKAAIRSAIMPGLGQIYNKKYWKVPIVYAAVGIPAGLFVYNKNWYDRTRYALSVVANNSYNNADSMARVHTRLKPLVDLKAEGSLLNYRNEFRKNMDYSILFTLLFWGLNVVDATVDAHLKDFDVSDDLSLKIKPAIIGPNYTPGVSFVFTIGAKSPKSNTFATLQ